MKVAHFVGTFKKEDGVGVVITNLVREGALRGIESMIVTGWAEDPSQVAAVVFEIPSVTLPLYTDYKIPLPGVRGFSEKLDAWKPDIIHIHSPDPAAWAVIRYAKKRGIPVLATHHSDFVRYLSYFSMGSLASLTHQLLGKLYRSVALVTTPSDETTKDISSAGVTVRTIPWAVDHAVFNPTFRDEAWRTQVLGKGDGRIILCICRLIWYKDLRVLAAAYQELKKTHPQFRMVIAGDGPAREELEALMSGALFVGHIEGGELSKVYASSDILLFPSQTETFGNVTLEAMASGVVPVVANAGGSKSLVVDAVTGFVAEPGNVSDFVKKVSILLDDAEKLHMYRDNGLARAKKYTWSAVSETFLNIYKSLGA